MKNDFLDAKAVKPKVNEADLSLFATLSGPQMKQILFNPQIKFVSRLQLSVSLIGYKRIGPCFKLSFYRVIDALRKLRENLEHSRSREKGVLQIRPPNLRQKHPNFILHIKKPQ